MNLPSLGVKTYQKKKKKRKEKDIRLLMLTYQLRDDFQL